MSKPNILCSTQAMTNEEWLAARAHGPNGDIEYTIGGSDVATVFGLNPWTTPLELYKIKRGEIEVPKKDNEDTLEMGHLLEPIAAHFYAKKTGYTVEEDFNLYQHADHPYALANIDRMIILPDGSKGILECKSTTYHKASSWADGAIPLYYELQLRFYMAVLDLDFGAFSAMWGNNPANDIAIPKIKRDLAKEKMIFDKLDEFIWRLENGVPPTMEDIDPSLAFRSLSRIYGKSNPTLSAVEFPKKYSTSFKKILTIQDEISLYKKEIKRCETELEAHSVKIAEIMADSEKGYLETDKGTYFADYPTKYRSSVDSLKLRNEYPDVFEEVKKVSDSRKLKISFSAK